MSPFFIIANPRSGSTLLRLMLSCHPELCVPQEAGFLISLYREFKNFSGNEKEVSLFVEALMNSSKIENWRVSKHQFEDEINSRKPLNYAELIDAVYKAYMKLWQPGKKTWGDKNNFFLNNIELISSIFPKAKFIHLVRDGRDVACSYRSLSQVKGDHSPRLSANLSEAALNWKTNIKKIENSFAGLPEWQKISLRYEDLVGNPEESLTRVANFLGVTYSSDMLQYHTDRFSHHYEPSSFDKWKGLNKSSLTNSRIGRWEKEMFSGDIYFFQKIAGKELQSYNYDLTQTSFSIMKLLKNLLKSKIR